MLKSNFVQEQIKQKKDENTNTSIDDKQESSYEQDNETENDISALF